MILVREETNSLKRGGHFHFKILRFNQVLVFHQLANHGLEKPRFTLTITNFSN